jgi:hypothetical protein
MNFFKWFCLPSSTCHIALANIISKFEICLNNYLFNSLIILTLTCHIKGTLLKKKILCCSLNTLDTQLDASNQDFLFSPFNKFSPNQSIVVVNTNSFFQDLKIFMFSFGVDIVIKDFYTFYSKVFPSG